MASDHPELLGVSSLEFFTIQTFWMLTRLGGAYKVELVLFQVWSEGVFLVNDCFDPNSLFGQFGFILLDHDGKAWFPFGHFLSFVARFGFSYQQKATTSNAMLKWKHPQKTKTSNKKP